jgi:hypothetical protein
MHSVIVIHWQQWDAYSKLIKDVDGLGTVCGLLTQDVDGRWTICSLLFVRLPTWLIDVYEHESFITQEKWAKTYESLFNILWRKK